MIGYSNFCVGCGCHLETVCLDCRQCAERMNKRRRYEALRCHERDGDSLAHVTGTPLSKFRQNGSQSLNTSRRKVGRR